MERLETLKANIEQYIKDLKTWETKMVIPTNIDIVSGIRHDLMLYIDAVSEPATNANASEANLIIPVVVCSLDSKSKTIGLTLDKEYKVLAEHKDDYKHIDEIAIINDFGDFGIYTREHFV